MTSTNELRFVERKKPEAKGVYRTIHVLQQKWEPLRKDYSDWELDCEWRDVPIVKETA